MTHDAAATPAEFVLEDDPSCFARRLRLWRDAVGDHMAEIDLSPAGDLPAERALRGRLSLRAFDQATVARIDAGAQLLRRTRERIRRARSETVFVNVVISGACLVEQDGRRSVAGPGTLCLYDTADPYRVETSPDFSSLLIGAPRERLTRALGDLRPLTGALAPGAASGLAARWWIGLADELGGLTRGAAEDMIAVGLDMLAAAVRSQAPPHAPGRDAGLLRRARREIERNFAEPGFGVRELGALAGCSPRRLQEAFARDRDTPTAAVRRMRLETARWLLADPRLAALPVKTLMARAGFADPAHFSRAFRAAFGVSPVDVRPRRPS